MQMEDMSLSRTTGRWHLSPKGGGGGGLEGESVVFFAEA